MVEWQNAQVLKMPKAILPKVTFCPTTLCPIWQFAQEDILPKDFMPKVTICPKRTKCPRRHFAHFLRFLPNIQGLKNLKKLCLKNLEILFRFPKKLEYFQKFHEIDSFNFTNFLAFTFLNFLAHCAYVKLVFFQEGFSQPFSEGGRGQCLFFLL